jgi:hypothetical protein
MNQIVRRNYSVFDMYPEFWTHILNTMQDGNDIWAYTDLLFEDFPANRERKERAAFKIVKK